MKVRCRFRGGSPRGTSGGNAYLAAMLASYERSDVTDKFPGWLDLTSSLVTLFPPAISLFLAAGSRWRTRGTPRWRRLWRKWTRIRAGFRLRRRQRWTLGLIGCSASTPRLAGRSGMVTARSGAEGGGAWVWAF